MADLPVRIMIDTCNLGASEAIHYIDCFVTTVAADSEAAAQFVARGGLEVVVRLHKAMHNQPHEEEDAGYCTALYHIANTDENCMSAVMSNESILRLVVELAPKQEAALAVVAAALRCAQGEVIQSLCALGIRETLRTLEESGQYDGHLHWDPRALLTWLEVPSLRQQLKEHEQVIQLLQKQLSPGQQEQYDPTKASAERKSMKQDIEALRNENAELKQQLAAARHNTPKNLTPVPPAPKQQAVTTDRVKGSKGKGGKGGKGSPPPRGKTSPKTRQVLGRMPTVAMRSLHWTPNGTDDASSVWSNHNFTQQLKTVGDSLDFDTLETLFKAPSGQPRSATKKPKPTTPIKQVTSGSLLSLTRANNIGITLSRVTVQFDEMVRAINQIDTKVLSLDAVTALATIVPPKTEITLVNDYLNSTNEDLKSLGKEEQFVAVVGTVPRLACKLEVIRTAHSFKTDIQEVGQAMSFVQAACEELQHSELLRRLLATVLMIGNFMNVNSLRGSASGVKIESLAKMADCKASDGKCTLLDYLKGHASDKDPDLLQLCQKLTCTAKVKRLSLAALRLKPTSCMPLCS